MGDYEPYRKQQIENGQVFQDFVVDVSWHLVGLAVVQYTSKLYQHAVGESKSRCEIKWDMQYAKTGNLWIETGEKARPREGDYYPSGIMRDDNTWLYIIGDYDRIFYCQKNILQMLSRMERRFPPRENGTKTSLGFLLPVSEMEKYAGVIVEPQCSKVIHKSREEMQRAAAELYRGANVNPRQMDLFSAFPEAPQLLGVSQ